MSDVDAERRKKRYRSTVFSEEMAKIAEVLDVGLSRRLCCRMEKKLGK